MIILEKIKNIFIFSDKRVKLLPPCIITFMLVLSIFIPWSLIFKSNETLEAFVGLLCMFLIGLLILLVYEWILVCAYIASFILYILFVIKNWKVEKARLYIIIFTGVLIFSFLHFNEVKELFRATFTFDWWGDSKYFGKGF